MNPGTGLATDPGTDSTTRKDSRLPPVRSRLLGRDVVELGTMGLRARPARAVLSALGIAIGIAAMVAVLGISSSNQAQLNQRLDALGTNLLIADAGQSLTGEPSALPRNTVAKTLMIPGVQSASSTTALGGLGVYRSHLIDEGRTGGLTVRVAGLDLPAVTGAEVTAGTWLNPATSNFPATVLGSRTAARLGVETPGTQVWLGGSYFTVVGILDPVELVPELDTTALIGEGIAAELFAYDGVPSTGFLRTDDAAVEEVRTLLGRTVNPQKPEEVAVSRPSDALAARNAVDAAFTGLLLGLGSVALLVGGIGVANTMVISVLERRREIGLRRALGATRRHIRAQFLCEALLLSALGGAAGAVLGVGVTSAVAVVNGWPVAIPPAVIALGIGATIAIGAVAGLYPAIRAAKTPPTSALNS